MAGRKMRSLAWMTAQVADALLAHLVSRHWIPSNAASGNRGILSFRLDDEDASRALPAEDYAARILVPVGVTLAAELCKDALGFNDLSHGLPGAEVVCLTFYPPGVTVRGVRQYDIQTDTWPCRFDVCASM